MQKDPGADLPTHATGSAQANSVLPCQGRPMVVCMQGLVRGAIARSRGEHSAGLTLDCSTQQEMNEKHQPRRTHARRS